MYKPPAEIVPQSAPPQPKPVTLQTTAVLLVPVTAALNCCCAPVLSWTLAGDTATATGDDETMDTVADPEMETLDNEVAVTRTVTGLGGVAGAV